ncbi:MAG: NAD(P)/FAD-dependent oxidoreductase [Methanobacterium sp.]|uniref:NAD(P)/FAD-dependent oxidoreductase n=1 Tax=Methanobacterium sp. TaxID=2164 RepID=UPI003D654CAE|nr:NAD(P)/FAD-dependent oxidoreductase [Methanobacterium sp.]
MNQKTAIIIGAGPAGLTAAYELLDKTDIKPIIYEMTEDIGGISKTVRYKGNRIDIGGHRFFSKNDRVMEWWQNIMPLQGAPAKDDAQIGRAIPISKECVKREIGTSETIKVAAPDPEKEDKVMLNRGRLSRIFFLRNFFDYPISLNLNTFSNLGLIRTLKIGLSYIKISLSPIKEEKSLEDFFINRFGRELYLTFFKDYTEKVWGINCDEINPDWGAQRIKGLSITKAIVHAVKSKFSRDSSIEQKKVETSLIEQFMYPKFGPGQMWEEVARIIRENGGEIHHNRHVIGIEHEDNEITGIKIKDVQTGEIKTEKGDYYFSTMPVKDLIQSMEAPSNIKNIASGLMYRDFITVGLLLNELKIKNTTKQKTMNNIVPDNWIYIQERDVKLGRLQIFNNWSPYLLEDDSKSWIGLEYFCNEGDELWKMADDDFTKFAIDELAKIDIINKENVLDSVVIRVPKTYPAYFGAYEQFNDVREFTDKFENLFLIGRNGMHRYNNMDHSMLTAMTAVENIMNNVNSKDNLWSINAEEEYHEEK